MGQYWLVLGGTGSKRAVLVANDICFQKIYGLPGVNHQIIQQEEGKSDDEQTNGHTDR